MKKRVLVTSRSFGSTSSAAFDLLREAGVEAEMMGADFTRERFRESAASADALIIGGHSFGEEEIRLCGNLKIVCKHGTGVDNIPLSAAKEMGIRVTNVPNTNTDAVADLAIGLMISVARGIVLSAGNQKKGIAAPVIGTGVCDKTLGLMGFGNIARAVALRSRGFRMRVLACDPYLDPAAAGPDFAFVEFCGRDRLLAESDFLSLHLPLTAETRNLADAAFMERMKPGAFLINTARGGIVDETALYNAVSSGRLAGAALDVTEKEPVPPTHPLLGLDNVVVTGHIGMYAREALDMVSVVCARNVCAIFGGGELTNIVV